MSSGGSGLTREQRAALNAEVRAVRYLPITAKNYTRVDPAGPARTFDHVILHTMESREAPGTARQVAEWFAGLAKDPAPAASAHYCVDAHEVIETVPEEQVAWGCGGMNRHTIHVELAGRASQNALQWMDEFSREMLLRAAALVADICWRREIPAEVVDVDGLIHRRRGITLHRFATQAFHVSTHTDPGVDFPLNPFVSRVRQELVKLRGTR